MGGVQVNRVGTTAANTEGGSFIHIHPDAVIGDVLMILYQLICPEIHRLRVVEVGEDRIAWPNRSNIHAAVRIFEPDVKLGTAVIWLVSDTTLAWFSLHGIRRSEPCNLRIRNIVRIRNVNASVEDRHIMSPRLMQFVQERLALFVREVNWIILKVAITLHIIDISPVGK
jgi:hypothetical protein